MLTPDSTGQLVVANYPGLPGFLRVLKGVGYFNRVGNNYGSADAPAQGVTIVCPDFINTIGSSYFNNNPNVRTARVISYSLEVTQVGPVLNQQGNVVTVRVPVGVEHPYTVMDTNYSASGAIIPGMTIAGLTGPQAFSCMASDPGNWSYSSLANAPDAKMCSATTPCGMHFATDEPEWRSCRTQTAVNSSSGTYITGTDTCPYTNIVAVTNPASTQATGSQIPVQNGGVIWPQGPLTGDTILLGDYWDDPAQDALIWAGANLSAANNSFMVRATMCVELTVDHNNSLYRPLILPPVPRDDKALAIVQAVMKVAPPSVSLAEGSNNWWSGLTTAVTGVGDLVSGLGLPVISPIAGMATKIAKMFLN